MIPIRRMKRKKTVILRYDQLSSQSGRESNEQLSHNKKNNNEEESKVKTTTIINSTSTPLENTNIENQPVDCTSLESRTKTTPSHELFAGAKKENSGSISKLIEHGNLKTTDSLHSATDVIYNRRKQPVESDRQSGRESNEHLSHNKKNNNEENKKVKTITTTLINSTTTPVENDNIENLPEDCASLESRFKKTLNNEQATGAKEECSDNNPNLIDHKSLNTSDLPHSPKDFRYNRFVQPAKDVENFVLNINLDIFNWGLFLLAFLTRFYRLSYPPNVVFDELHYGKSVAHYVRNIFFFDQHPPLGKQIIATLVDSFGYDGNFTGTRIGSAYEKKFPIFWMRFIPALCGSLLPSIVYTMLKTSGISRWCSVLGGLLIIFDNSLVTQSRLILMESMLIMFSFLGLYFMLKYQQSKFPSIKWFLYALASATMLAMAICVKYAGFFTYLLAVYLMIKYFVDLLDDPTITDCHIACESILQLIIFITVPLIVYMGVFYVHLQTLYKAGPHDAILTSAFQATLDGGLAAITRNQPMRVAHGSQITLRHTHGRRCWLHSHAHLYPVRYPDNRGSSHQQQVTCYPFKDVNNWWIVKKPDYEDVVVGDEPEFIKHGDIIQLVHGITSRALNSHDVAAPLTPQCQEVSCYIDYEINMKSELLWKVDIPNRETEGPYWKTIKSEVRLIHESTGAALRFTGRVLPEWGFNQHEVVADRTIENKGVIWNVEEHRYTKDSDKEERGRKLMEEHLIPTEVIKLSFFEKFWELQQKMLFTFNEPEGHMYSTQPWEWPLLTSGVAYWLDASSNRQIYLLGNILLWYTATFTLLVYFCLFIFYLLRRKRLFYDIEEIEWERLLNNGHLYFVGYLIHYISYYLKEDVLFLHHYMPAFIMKVQLLCYVVDHFDYLLRLYCCSSPWMLRSYRMAVLAWLMAVIGVYVQFLPFTYGFTNLTVEDMIKLRWKEGWWFATHRPPHEFWT